MHLCCVVAKACTLVSLTNGGLLPHRNHGFLCIVSAIMSKLPPPFFSFLLGITFAECEEQVAERASGGDGI